MQNLEKILDKYYSENDPVIIGCSTWPDSMYLLHKVLETKYAKNVVACYFNHQLRPESDQEELFIEKLWKEKWFKVEIASADIRKIRDNFHQSKGIEEVAREKRYAFFNAICNVYETNKVLTAHHLDDKIETFFFNLARWSKLTGLINMTEESGGIIRPLLHISKTEILAYLEENQLEYKNDETNNDTEITRNYLRHEIVPKFEKINSNYKKNISNMMEYFEEVKSHLDEEIEKFLEEQAILIFNSEKYRINTLDIYWYFYISDFNKLSSLLQKEIIRHCFYTSNNKSTIWLSEWNISEVIKFINWKNNKTVKEIQELKMTKENEIIIF